MTSNSFETLSEVASLLSSIGFSSSIFKDLCDENAVVLTEKICASPDAGYLLLKSSTDTDPDKRIHDSPALSTFSIKN